ncbi:transposase [uncultured Ilyobacter sp.]|uniref:transposase n=1 Tax=uncultured Ilyobacter sp. TaxID=544433 RepID=UPI0029C91142|nr:transposase [uncultured Ilyobacter sp.]
MTNEKGLPVEYKILPGSIADITAFKDFSFDLPKDAIIYADRAYNDYVLEDVLSDVDIYLSPMRRKNSKRSKSKSQEFLDHIKRKLIETVGSSINRLMPKSIHSVTSRCFELKILLFLMGYTFLNMK